MSLIEGDTFWLIAHLGSSNNLESADINFGYISFCEVLHTIGRNALVTIAGDINVLAVCAELTIVGNVLSSCYGFAVGCDELHDVRPVDGNSNQVVINLNDVVGCVADFITVLVAKPLVAHHMVILEVGHASVISLPDTFVQQDDSLLSQCDLGKGV